MNNYFTNIGPDLAKKFENCTDKKYMKYMGESNKQSIYMFKTNPNEISYK